jgi:hypothetical protein
MNDNKDILGCFVSGGSAYFEDSQEVKNIAKEKGALFTKYIWGEKGISDNLKKLKHIDYGQDTMLILFQFYVNPIPYELQYLKEIENYRKKEKSIGVPIIITDENFFNKSEERRYDFLKQAILQKLDLLAELVKKKKLDTNMELLKSDLKNIFDKIL